MSGTEEALPRVERDDDGYPVFVHACTSGTVQHETLRLDREAGWWWKRHDTLMPSIRCEICGTHGWWRDEVWVPA